MQANATALADDKDRILFALSYMTGGVPERFAQNFVDARVAEDLAGITPAWGTYKAFLDSIKAAFDSQNKKVDSHNALVNLRQGKKTAEEFFVEFDQLARAANYHTGHDDVLVNYIRTGLNHSIVSTIYNADTLPADYKAWKEKAVRIDGLQRAFRQQPTKPFFRPNNPSHQAKASASTPTPGRRDATGTTYGGQGMRMDVDAARSKGLCFGCGEPGHIKRNCPHRNMPDKMKIQATETIQDMSREERAELKASIEAQDAKDFPPAQQ